MSQYPKDEFDLAAEERGPKGVHRRTQSGFKRFLPYILVILLGVLLALVIVSILNRDNDGSGPVDPPTSTEQSTDQATDAPTDPDAGDPDGTDDPDGEATGGEGDPTDEESDEPTDEAVEPDLTASVSVLNGAGVQGLAGRVSEIVADDGFVEVEAGNYQSALPDVSYVYYQNADLADTAQYIADLLGIEPVEELGSASNEIVVVLRADFNE